MHGLFQRGEFWTLISRPDVKCFFLKLCDKEVALVPSKRVECGDGGEPGSQIDGQSVVERGSVRLLKPAADCFSMVNEGGSPVAPTCISIRRTTAGTCTPSRRRFPSQNQLLPDRNQQMLEDHIDPRESGQKSNAHVPVGPADQKEWGPLSGAMRTSPAHSDF